MNHILRPYLDHFILVYLDDILIYSKTEEEHAEYVQKTLQALKNNDLFYHPQKLAFGFHKIKFVSHVIFSNRIAVDDDKVVAIKEWPRLTNVSEVHSFLRLTSYYCHFI